MKRLSIPLLNTAVLLMGAMLLAVYVFMLPVFARESSTVQELAFWRYPALAGWYATAVPIYFAIYQTLLLLRYIGKQAAFSNLAVKALHIIAKCAFSVSLLFAAGLPAVYIMADLEDAPGLMLIGLIIACVPTAIATFATVLERLLEQAIRIKEENELTV